ncbi:LamB/YcsF family protein [Oceaniferula spumae]|uniref:LamB/YcsF family protein n=1 Tax=Oceaniferula spumae TaxID=2979115 RepID=A0AAT9FJV5_9BACT
MPKKLHINCDLGEWEADTHTAALMQHIHLANIACGGHAGSAETITRCAKLAAEHGVLTGAHPGVSGNRGRVLPDGFTTDDFIDLLESQINLYLSTGTPLNHIKLHGALYHLSETDHSIRGAFLNFAKKRSTPIIALAGGTVAIAADALNIPVLHEAFLDRNYLPDGNLVPRTEPNAQLTDLPEIKKRILEYHQEKSPIAPDTLCIHSDSPTCLTIAETARDTLDQLGHSH